MPTPKPSSTRSSAIAQLSALVAKAPGQRIPRTVDEVRAGRCASSSVSRSRSRRRAPTQDAWRRPTDHRSHDADGRSHPRLPERGATRRASTRPTSPSPRPGSGRSLRWSRGLADGDVVLDPGCDWDRARAQLLALPGIGPWTAEVIAMRGLGDPDAFPVSRSRRARRGEDLGLPAEPKALDGTERGWRPWRAYATQHLWTALEHDSQRVATQGCQEGGRMTVQYRTIDSPVGPLTLAGETGGYDICAWSTRPTNPAVTAGRPTMQRLRRRRRTTARLLRRRSDPTSISTSTWSVPTFSDGSGRRC